MISYNINEILDIYKNQTTIKDELYNYFLIIRDKYLQIDYDYFLKEKLIKTSLDFFYLKDYENLFTIADKMSKGQLSQEQALDNIKTKAIGGATTTLASTLALIGVASGGILTAVGGLIALSNTFISWNSITSRQRSDDEVNHLRNYIKKISQINYFPNHTKEKIVINLTKLSNIRPKCKALTDNCSKEHLRYWIQGKIYRDLIDNYINEYNNYLLYYDRNKFLEFLNINKKNINEIITKTNIKSKTSLIDKIKIFLKKLFE